MYTRASQTDILARKTARRTKVRGQVGELNEPRAPRQADFRTRRTRRLPRENPRAEVGEEVRVCFGVRVGPVEFKLYERVHAPAVAACCSPCRRGTARRMTAWVSSSVCIASRS